MNDRFQDGWEERRPGKLGINAGVKKAYPGDGRWSGRAIECGQDGLMVFEEPESGLPNVSKRINPIKVLVTVKGIL